MYLDCKCLIIEDDESLLQTLKTYLTVSMELHTASNLSMGRKLLKKMDFNLIILDKTLPDGNGLDFLKEIREANSHIAVIMMTGDQDFNVINKALSSGADDYVIKSEEIIQNLLVRSPVALRHSRERIKRLTAERRPNLQLPLSTEDLSEKTYDQFLKESEKLFLQTALKICNDNIDLLSKKIGMARSTIFRKLSELNIARQRQQEESSIQQYGDL